MDKLKITAALTYSINLPTQKPHFPSNTQQIAEESVRCVEPGAASVHVCDPATITDKYTTALQVFRETASLIKALTNVIFCHITDGTTCKTTKDRTDTVSTLKSELVNCNMESNSFSIYPIVYHYKGKEFKYDWEKPLAIEKRILTKGS